MVSAVLALDSWNYYSGEAGLTAKHLPSQCLPHMASLNQRKYALL